MVPAEENTDLLVAERYRDMGRVIEIIEVKEGTRAQGHHFDHLDPKRVADFIEKHAQGENRDGKEASKRQGKAN